MHVISSAARSSRPAPFADEACPPQAGIPFLAFSVCAVYAPVRARDLAAVNRNGENLSALNSAFPLTIQSRTIFAVTGASKIPFR